MRTSFRAVLLTISAVAALALSGCVQFHSAITIDAQGGGKATMTASVDTEVLAALTEMGKTGSAGMGADVPDFDKITRAYLEQRATGRGVTITKFDKSTSGGRQTMSVALDFKDLKGLSYVMNNVTSGAGANGLGIFAADGGNFILRDAKYDFPPEPKDAKAPPAEPTPEQMQKQMELAGTLMGALGDLDISMSFTVPGDVVRSNAPKVEGRTSVWAVTAENMMDQQNDMAPEIVFSGKGLNLKPLQEKK